MRRVSTIPLVAALALLLAACGASHADAPPSVTAVPIDPTITIRAGEPIQIGVSSALSGDQINLGTDIADAAELAISDFGASVQGHAVRIVRMDDGCTDPEKAVDVARSLAKASTVAGVIGPMCTVGAQAANSVYAAAGLVHIAPSATRAELSEQGDAYFFRTAWRDDEQSAVQAAFARDRMSAGSVVVVDDGEPYGRGLADSFVERFEARSGRVLSRERIDRGTTDVSSVVRKILAASPDCVVFEGFNPEGALTVKALRDAAFTGGFIGPDGLLSGRDFFPTAGAGAEGAVVTGGAMPDSSFLDRFTQKFGRAPGTPFVLQSHDAMTLLLRAITSASTSDNGVLTLNRAKLADTVRDADYDGLTGKVAFDEHGERRGDAAREVGLTIYRVTAGAFVPAE